MKESIKLNKLHNLAWALSLYKAEYFKSNVRYQNTRIDNAILGEHQDVAGISLQVNALRYVLTYENKKLVRELGRHRVELRVRADFRENDYEVLSKDLEEMIKKARLKEKLEEELKKNSIVKHKVFKI